MIHIVIAECRVCAPFIIGLMDVNWADSFFFRVLCLKPPGGSHPPRFKAADLKKLKEEKNPNRPPLSMKGKRVNMSDGAARVRGWCHPPAHPTWPTLRGTARGRLGVGWGGAGGALWLNRS